MMEAVTYLTPLITVLGVSVLWFKLGRVSQKVDDYAKLHDIGCPLKNGKADKIYERINVLEGDVKVLNREVLKNET